MIRLIVEYGGVCVQRGKCQVTGFGNSQSHLDRFEIAHFADQHDVRVLTKRGAESVRRNRACRRRLRAD